MSLQTTDSLGPKPFSFLKDPSPSPAVQWGLQNTFLFFFTKKKCTRHPHNIQLTTSKPTTQGHLAPSPCCLLPEHSHCSKKRHCSPSWSLPIPLPGPWYPPVCFLSLETDPFWTFHINAITHHVPGGLGLLSVSIRSHGPGLPLWRAESFGVVCTPQLVFTQPCLHTPVRPCAPAPLHPCARRSVPPSARASVRPSADTGATSVFGLLCVTLPETCLSKFSCERRFPNTFRVLERISTGICSCHPTSPRPHATQQPRWAGSDPVQGTRFVPLCRTQLGSSSLVCKATL